LTERRSPGPPLGVLRREPHGSTDRAAWLARAELAAERTVSMIRTSLENAFEDD